MKKSSIKKIFWILAVVFVLLVGFIFIPFSEDLKNRLFPFVGVLAVLLCIFGLVLFFKIRRIKFKDRWLRRWLLLTSISPLGILVSIGLHNLISGIGVYLTGNELFEEAVFFTLGTIGFPLLFLVGAVGVLVRMKRKGIGGIF